MKKGFTLFELIIVIIIISIVFGFAITSFNFGDDKKENLTLNNLKKFLSQKEYNKNISVKCSPDVNGCFFYVDEIIQNELLEIKNSNKLETYSYDDKLSQVDFNDVEPKELERYSVNFEITMDKDKKHKDLVVYDGEKYYIFNSIHLKPTIAQSSSDISDYFYEIKKEVKDSAF